MACALWYYEESEKYHGVNVRGRREELGGYRRIGDGIYLFLFFIFLDLRGFVRFSGGYANHEVCVFLYYGVEVVFVSG